MITCYCNELGHVTVYYLQVRIYTTGVRNKKRILPEIYIDVYYTDVYYVDIYYIDVILYGCILYGRILYVIT